MILNYFEGKTKEWLLARRDALQDALASGVGSQTHVAIAPGMGHDFTSMTQGQIEDQLKRVLYALFRLDPTNYSDPYVARSGVTIGVFQ